MILGNSITGGASSLSFSSGENSSHDGHSRCILLAEDDADDVFLVRRSFRKAGLSHRILDVGDGAIVIDYLSGKGLYSHRNRYPVPNVMWGVELQYGSRANFKDDWDYSAVRVHLSFKYNFGHTLYRKKA